MNLAPEQNGMAESVTEILVFTQDSTCDASAMG